MPASPALSWRDVPQAVLHCDSDWRIVEANEGLEELLGYPEGVAKGLELLQLAMDGERTRVRRRFGAAGGVPDRLTVSCRRVDGGEVRTLWRIHPVTGGALVLLSEAVEPAQPGSTPVHALGAAVREPLMAVMGTAEALQYDALPPGVARDVQMLGEAAAALCSVLEAHAVSENTATPADASRLPAAPSPSPHRVLVVEDHAVNARVVQHALSRLGFQSDVVENGKLAVEAVETGAYDAILMDCQMPVMDGYEATRAIRQMEAGTDAHIPIIAVTAHALVGDRERCLASGMDDYLTKPVRLAQLYETLEDWLGTPAPTEEVRRTPGGPALLDQAALSQMRELLGDDFEETVLLFIDDTETLLDACDRALGDGDVADIVRRTHSLKSTSAYMGAKQLSALCDQVVRAGREQQLDRLPGLLGAVRADFDGVRMALREAAKAEAAT